MDLDSPAFATAEPSLTGQDSMTTFLAGLAAGSDRARLGSIGRSSEGRDIPIVYLTAEGIDDPAAIRRLGRPVIWLIAQQHGNEPAGGEAMLALASALGRGEMAALLDRLSVAIVPRANVDGAAAARRVLASGADANRDHLLLSQPEVRLLHAAMCELPPDVVFDHHEFSVGRRWVEKFAGSQGADVMILEATNPSIAPGLTAIARDLYRPALEAAIAERGLSSFDYVTTEAGIADRRVLLGGTAPGIARNAFGLRGAVAYLIETRGVGLGLANYRHRVSIHCALARALLQASARDAAGLLRRLAAARAAAEADGSDLIVAHEEGEREIDLPLVDAESGAPRPTTVRLVDSRDIRPVDLRRRPAGYLVTAGAEEVVRRLALHDVRLCAVTAATLLVVEAYEVARTGSSRSRNAINPDRLMRVRLRSHVLAVPAGTLFVPMAQLAAGLVAAALEPDSPASYLAAGVMPMADDDTEAPVYRVMDAAALPLRPR